MPASQHDQKYQLSLLIDIYLITGYGFSNLFNQSLQLKNFKKNCEKEKVKKF